MQIQFIYSSFGGKLEMKDISIKPLSNIIVDDFIVDNNLFTLFDSFPVNVLFLDNFISNIDSFKDVFTQLGMCGSIFFDNN